MPFRRNSPWSATEIGGRVGQDLAELRQRIAEAPERERITREIEHRREMERGFER